MSDTQSSTPVGSRQIPGYTKYRITQDGVVYSLRRKTPMKGLWAPMSPQIDKQGYCLCLIYGDDGHRYTRYIHHLVLETFVGPRPDGMQACHGPDFNLANNSLSNLRWDSPEANRAEQNRRRKGTYTTKSYTLKEDDVRAIRQRVQDGASRREIAREYRLHYSTISKIASRQCWASVE